ncbi:MAG TPA: MBL fold metallo-hydrolase [Candidatus Polarisedimenticolaceae bacterium]|nr:MBL fold metallo-hydrolase [Candidatus Polarisedimenticolaceae bacterium]
MSTGRYKLRFWGVRGTVPTPSPDKLRFGGNTSCLTVSLSDAEHLVFDCGTGLRLFGNDLAARRTGQPTRYHVFFSHYHFDHIDGLPYFHPLYDKHSTINFHGFAPKGLTIRSALETLISPPYFPVRLAEVPATLNFATIDGARVTFGDVAVGCLPLHHPDGSLCYRVEHGPRKIVFATDHEHGDERTDRALIEFAEDADYLIYDATYLRGEYETLRRGWGHSTWYAAVQTARAARVKTLILFHHHPDHSDDDLDEVLRFAREDLPSTEIAREGMELSF